MRRIMRRILGVALLTCIAAQAFAAGAPVRIDGGDTVTANTDVSVGSTTPTLVSPSNSNRAALTCSVTQAVRWGPANVSTTTGLHIGTDNAITIHNTAAVYMIAEASSSTVSCTEESWAAGSSGTGVFSP